jgi:hypothetical protein
MRVPSQPEGNEQFSEQRNLSGVLSWGCAGADRAIFAHLPAPAAPVATGVAQKAHRLAAIGMALRHSGHSFVVGSGGASPRRTRAISAFMGRTTKKYTAAAISRNETSALMKSPSKNLLPLTSNCIAEKSGLPTMAAISGVIRSFTRAVTMAPNAAPMTTATAKSSTLPRMMNCLNPLIVIWPLSLETADSQLRNTITPDLRLRLCFQRG